MGYPVYSAYPFSEPPSQSEPSQSRRFDGPTLPDDLKERIIVQIDRAKNTFHQGLARLNSTPSQNLTAQSILEQVKSDLLTAPGSWSTYVSSISRICTNPSVQVTEYQARLADFGSLNAWPTRRQWILIRGIIANSATVSAQDRINSLILFKLHDMVDDYDLAIDDSRSAQGYLPETGADLFYDHWTFERIANENALAQSGHR
ncbi:uncharacterized protein I303_108024 [Kwoniella dejecticola CBS 10117]|uniref:Uncharacterized protein n=1 Tax=Kwoniella dejecticola CBS 10117 TaxID=1296121 RepID=A0A1A5ZWC1_9TREE|nr:uncharacterized protein I303_08015 [Kwoniella dejecticola CBS 10117]OBR82101.1 hypothetical protein I303_08015 [Kwoniella dejecticola CBS 10117]